jgi:hypothetical protein
MEKAQEKGASARNNSAAWQAQTLAFLDRLNA